jgi:hypothetical protein
MSRKIRIGIVLDLISLPGSCPKGISISKRPIPTKSRAIFIQKSYTGWP